MQRPPSHPPTTYCLATFLLQHSTTPDYSHPSTFSSQGWGSAFMELLDQAFPGNDNVIINAGRNALPLYGIMQVGAQFVLYHRILVASCCSLLLPVASCCYFCSSSFTFYSLHGRRFPSLPVSSFYSYCSPSLSVSPICSGPLSVSSFFPAPLCTLLFSDTPCSFHFLPVGPHRSLFLAVAPCLRAGCPEACMLQEVHLLQPVLNRGS